MRTNLLEPELEDLLRTLVNAADDSGFVKLANGYTPKIKELERRGYLEKLDGDLSGNAFAWLSYKGATYFEAKEKILLEAEASGERIGQMALSVLESVSSGVFSVSELSEERMREIARMSRQGLLSVQYADNIPWFVSVTDLGESVLKLGGVGSRRRRVAACLLTVATTLTFTAMHWTCRFSKGQRVANRLALRGNALMP